MQKIIGGTLIFSGVVLLILQVISFSEARESWGVWASPESGAMWFAGALVLELVFLLSRFALGYLVFLNGRITPWLFYPLGALTAVSGLSGIVLVLAALALRFWQGGAYVAKT